MVWVRERTIPTERPPLVGEVNGNCDHSTTEAVALTTTLRNLKKKYTEALKITFLFLCVPPPFVTMQKLN
jgi:hypothetical protein